MSQSSFAKSQLTKHGWKEGSGLGKKESGIKEAIKVKLKHDTHGVGHNRGDEFTFHWWDHVFNKAASSIAVEDSEEGVCVKKTAANLQGPIQSKKVKTFNNKEMLYGKFVKGATLANNEEHREDNEDESDNDKSDEDDKQKLNKLNDEEMLKLCGGMTAHKAARHGHKLNGKLLRIQEQEQLLYEKYKKKSTNQNDAHKTEEMLSSKSSNQISGSSDELLVELSENPESDDGVLKKKKKKNKKSKDKNRNDVIEDTVLDSTQKVNIKKKDKKKRKCLEESDGVDIDLRDDCPADSEKKTLVKCSDDSTLTIEDIDENSSRKSKKRKKDKKSETVECDSRGDNGTNLDNDNRKSKKKKKSKK